MSKKSCTFSYSELLYKGARSKTSWTYSIMVVYHSQLALEPPRQVYLISLQYSLLVSFLLRSARVVDPDPNIETGSGFMAARIMGSRLEFRIRISGRQMWMIFLQGWIRICVFLFLKDPSPHLYSSPAKLGCKCMIFSLYCLSHIFCTICVHLHTK